MIIEEILENGLIHHYSDRGKTMIQNETGIEYSDAIDGVPCRYTYSETENDIEEDVMEEPETDYG